MRVAVTSPFFHLLPYLKDELLAAYPDCKFKETFDPFDKEELIKFCKGCDAALIGLDRFDEEVLIQLPDLKIIALCSAGADHLDPAALKRHNVKMGWVDGINKHAVAEMTISTMINIMRNFHHLSEQLHQGKWPNRRGGHLLQGKTVGIHGCGNIGQEVVRRLKPFGVHIIACDRIKYSHFYKEFDVEEVTPEELWSKSEVLTIHLSRNQSTIGLYSANVLDKLRPGIFLINTSRGRIIDEEALFNRLKTGKIGAAHLDVFETEPVQNSLDLFKLPNFMGTPHTGAGAKEAWEAMARSGIRNLSENWIPEPGTYPYD